jgi:large subunit ribosomal protein L16
MQPKKTKYKKYKKPKIKINQLKFDSLQFGEYGLKTLESCRLSAKQIESGRLAIGRIVKRSGKLWIRIFPDNPVSNKPSLSRMGKGKGSTKYWVSIIKPGSVLYEISGLNLKMSLRALSYAQTKMPMSTMIIK